MAYGIEPETFILRKEFLEETIDPDSGLLDKLLISKALSLREIREIKGQHLFHMRNSYLLQYVIDKSKYDCLISALKDTNQVHIVNYLNAKGEYKDEEIGDEWPLTEVELSTFNANQDVLIDLIEPGDFIGRLFSKGVINRRQMDTISSKLSCHEKNEALLEILRRRSLKDFKTTIRCLRNSNQDHIADIFTKGGVVVKVHAEGLDDTTEDEIITAFQRILSNKTPEERQRIIVAVSLNVIGAKKGESVVLYIHCKTVIEIIHLKEMQIKGTLRTAVQHLFMKLLTHVQSVEVRVENPQILVESMLDLQLRQSQFDGMTVTLSEDEYERCRLYFQEGIKLRAVCDFNPEEMSEVQRNELKTILQTKYLKDKGSEISDKTFSLNRGLQEEKRQDIPGEEKGNAESEIKEKLNRKAQIIEDDDIMETELELRASSTCFQREHKRVKKYETETQLSQLQEGALMTKLEYLEASSSKPADTSKDSEADSEDSNAEPEYSEYSSLKHERKSEDAEVGSEDLKTESQNLDSGSSKSENMSNVILNSKALSFRKGDQMETIPPADIGDVINWWKVKHMESGVIGYIPRILIVIDYELQYKTEINQTANMKEITFKTTMTNLPFELLDSILLKSYLESVLRENQVMKNKDYDAINQLASVESCWFQRFKKRKFKKEMWRSLIVFYRRKEKKASFYRINRQYFEENIRLQGLVSLLKCNKLETLVQIESLCRQNVPLDKNSLKGCRVLISEVLKKSEPMHSDFTKILCDTKQQLIAEIIENGGAMTKVEIKIRKSKSSIKTQLQNLQIVKGINEIRNKKRGRSHQIEKLMDKLKEDDMEILNAGHDGEVIVVWIWCKTKYALEKLRTLNKSKCVINIFAELFKNFSFSPEERNSAMIKPNINIDFEQFEKTVVFFPIVANSTSRLNLKRVIKDEEEVWGVTKLRNKIYVLLHKRRPSAPCRVILVFEDQNPFRLQKRIEIKEIEDPQDIASIEKENSLYVLDWGICVWKIKEEGDEEEKKEKIIRWLELRDYYGKIFSGLSVTRYGQLLLACQIKMDDPFFSLMIFEGSEKADLRRSIPLPEDIQTPHHAVETFKGNFIISHAIKRKKEEESGSGEGRRQMEEEKKEEMWVVSEVSGDGKTILRRFISKNKEQELCFSYVAGLLAADSLDRVFLAENDGDRVILFDYDLHWNGVLIPTQEDIKEGTKIRPRSLFYCEERKELIIGGEEDVFCYTLNRK